MLRVEKILANAEKSQGKYPSFDYISVTPPYLEVNYSTLLDQLARSTLVGKDCFILVEYPLKTDMAESCGNLIKIADRRFGRTNLLIYGPTWSEKEKNLRWFLKHQGNTQEINLQIYTWWREMRSLYHIIGCQELKPPLGEVKLSTYVLEITDLVHREKVIRGALRDHTSLSFWFTDRHPRRKKMAICAVSIGIRSRFITPWERDVSVRCYAE